ncbi:Undecaprenyl phosphate-aminoarabinose flippase subunit ArnF [Variovorax sp. PBL-H6]|uniref:EamA family transporter n=1 Tax=Variovorax sp. PBL-H6 TaxID=434009 RepID=UPI001318BB08|nr:EamA family transporter [Variovorax sp. PBL-H6]VTU17382.1 Undecaprenyl phosphate-aminoarabinose flippase subunit ArnF [Variovorax sp. PBL-H6]
MIARLTDYIYIAATIGFTVYGQLILKWRVGFHGHLPAELADKVRYIFGVLFDPWVVSGLTAAFLASLTWIAAMTKFQLSHAYPFMSLNFVIVLALSAWLLNEPVTLAKVFGVAMIVIGTVAIARG